MFSTKKKLGIKKNFGFFFSKYNQKKKGYFLKENLDLFGIGIRNDQIFIRKFYNQIFFLKKICHYYLHEWRRKWKI
ncbi:hypothetical protein GLOIN_2v382745 [Rhizophagus irregularis DAOM 181602=DAOM 197198]|uniref:Uncharacterized protein n=1 Tax=Rhizophagus irregularis (strain DAOM 181602 / DAOM 197198 / MUCL 43194) TaxID=747089 RepID=A0A2P4QZL8_RHIID|nr:hypothetical protein GLOIN_2v382745 [Rhizophagus irregularis DAOM 181602=DAOM 197198]POG83035.1 hypothetical protein GLOIN_2v382745 [Rhizophagus irregularis DAOM 181602=DAOM 197198]|eukprot:XP_025189901.1 hypothetical protein GLOIN_2v382745 [Rhizophagus irregularis DAOM 181602=DAOM 197198]